MHLFLYLLDNKSGVLRLWTVANAAPIENIRIKKTGFQSLCVFSSSRQDYNKITSRVMAHTHQTPSAQILCAFQDGGVGVYNVKKRKWSFLREEVFASKLYCLSFI